MRKHEYYRRATALERSFGALWIVRLMKIGIGTVLAGAVGAGYWLRAHGLSPEDLAAELHQGDSPRFEWQSIDKKHWQVVADTGEPPEVTDAREGTSAGCPAGMVRVQGAFRRERGGGVTGEIERLQDAACIDWISREFPARCRTFDREKIASDVSTIPTQAMDYCIDRFEYPNVLGQSPMIVATFREAEATCKKASKRLCTENEWTFACEGEDVRPYPNGWTRDTTACVIDRSWRPFTEGALQPRDGDGARQELDRLWQGEPSGSRGGCRSPFGVYDMTGNVDEWTRSVNTTGYASILKGGYWGPVRARCRPATRAHNEDFVAYQQSFRCCGDANTDVAAPAFAGVVALGDAGPSAVSTTSSDEGGFPPVDLEIQWAPSGGDEIEAIAKARARLCSTSSSVSAGAGEASALAPLALAALIAMRRRRR